jgi:hypothetical protein
MASINLADGTVGVDVIETGKLFRLWFIKPGRSRRTIRVNCTAKELAKLARILNGTCSGSYLKKQHTDK